MASTLPEELIRSLQNAEGFDEKAFRAVHEATARSTSIRLNPQKLPLVNDELVITTAPGKYSALNAGNAVPWSSLGYYLEERPSFTFDPLFHAGCYYVQEASGMFLEQAIKQTVDLTNTIRALDLCAAPGGKSTHIQSLISKDSLLVSNEVIRGRANILVDNIIRWGCNNVVVTGNDPRDFSSLENYFDLVVVDAPCSGSGLFRRDNVAIEQWSPGNVELCCGRQQRILSDVFPSLKAGGIFIYSTCSYSIEENEDVVDWLSSHFDVENIALTLDKSWNIKTVTTKAANKAYRFWPYNLLGEGFFMAVFRKKSGEEKFIPRHKSAVEYATKSEAALAGRVLSAERFEFTRQFNSVVAVTPVLANELDRLQSILRVQYYGTRVGEVIRGKLVPDHAIAMSLVISASLPRIQLSYENAIQYLKRNELKIEPAGKGWQLVAYEDHILGWINVLPNRINNYYPKEQRILKDGPTPAAK